MRQARKLSNASRNRLRMTGWRRLGWFAAIYALSLSIFGAVVWLLRLVIP